MSNLSDLRASGAQPSAPHPHPAPHHTPQVENNANVIIPDGLIGQETVQLMEALLHPHHAEGASGTPDEESDEATPDTTKRKSNVRR